MADSSVGALVPSVAKEDTVTAPAAAVVVSSSETTDAAGRPAAAATAAGEDADALEEAATASAVAAERDKDLLCPICMCMIKDAFLTACGHSFCYMCIVTHLNNKSDCPCCGNYLTKNNLFPNFLLNKLLKKQSAHQVATTASPVEQLHLALQQLAIGCLPRQLHR